MIKTSIFAAALLAATSASAISVTTYTEYAAYAAAAGSIVTEDFEDATLVPGLSFTTTAGSIGSGRFNDRVFRGGAETTFAFAGGTKAAGGFYDETPGGFGQGLAFTLNLTGGGTYVLPQIDGYTGGFYGFISDTKFDSFLISAGVSGGVAETYNLDNLSFGAVPEASTWAMLIAGFGLVGATMRRRAAVATAA